MARQLVTAPLHVIIPGPSSGRPVRAALQQAHGVGAGANVKNMRVLIFEAGGKDMACVKRFGRGAGIGFAKTHHECWLVWPSYTGLGIRRDGL
jgi:hypothetical protein